MYDYQSELIAQLRTTLSKMELSLGAINDAIVWINEEGIVQWSNAKFSNLINIPTILILGKPIYNLLPELKFEDTVVPWQQIFIKPLLLEQIYKCTLKNKSSYLQIYANKFQEERKDASIVVVIQDVTESQKNLEKMKFMAAFPENNPMPIFAVNQQGSIIYANRNAGPILDHWKLTLGKPLPDSIVVMIDQAFKTKKALVIEESAKDNNYLFSITPTPADYVNVYGSKITGKKT